MKKYYIEFFEDGEWHSAHICNSYADATQYLYYAALLFRHSTLTDDRFTHYRNNKLCNIKKDILPRLSGTQLIELINGVGTIEYRFENR